MESLEPLALKTCRRRLLRWFEKNARDLPWRRTRDVYAIWISEIMLQQTQVQQALPYYLRFMQRFPDVAALAAAPLDEVLKQWEGMGYYARARNLHRAAGQIMEEHDGRFPAEVKSVTALAGIGAYTAAAILSIAFGRPLAVVDGNVIRVISRLHAWPGDARSTAGKQRLQEMAQRLLDARAPGTFNEAMMELGALICTPQNPLCRGCPVRACCRAFGRGEAERFPLKATPRPRPHHHMTAAVIWKDGTILIARRPEKGLLGGLWELPGGRQEAGEGLEEALARATAETLDIGIAIGGLYARLNHAYTHFSITLHVFTCRYLSGAPRAALHSDWRWVAPCDLDRFAFPRAHRRIIDQLLREAQP